MHGWIHTDVQSEDRYIDINATNVTYIQQTPDATLVHLVGGEVIKLAKDVTIDGFMRGELQRLNQPIKVYGSNEVYNKVS